MIKELIWTQQNIRNSLSWREQLSKFKKRTFAWYRFWKNYDQYNQASFPKKLDPDYLYPCLGDDTAETAIEPIYFYQDAWAFEQIVKMMPSDHIDVASHHKFVSFLSKIVRVTMVDIRPLSLPLASLNFKHGSILNLPLADKSVESLSSLCVIEHIGLGRYGDPIDPNGTEKAIEELKRVMMQGGNLYVSLPVDSENRTYFNAHRAFREQYIISLFEGFELIQARYIFGNEFCEEIKSGSGVACYHFRRF